MQSFLQIAAAVLVLGSGLVQGGSLLPRCDMIGNPERAAVKCQLDPKNTPLYGKDGPLMVDIEQANLGNCWLAAAAAAVAHTQGAHLESICYDLGNGKANVSLWNWQTGVLHSYIIKKPTQAGGLSDTNMHGSLSQGSWGYWPVVLQDAFLEFSKEFGDALGMVKGLEGGNSYKALLAMFGTGPSMSRADLAELDDDALWEIINAATIRPSTADTPECDGKSDICRDSDKLTNNLAAYHEYTIVSGDTAADRVRLRNPWAHVSQSSAGTPESGGQGVTTLDNGVFEISLKDFRTFFKGYAQINPVYSTEEVRKLLRGDLR